MLTTAILCQVRPVFPMPADCVIDRTNRAFTAHWPRIGRPMWRGALSLGRSWRQPSRCASGGRTGGVVVSGERSRSEGREERLHAVLASIAEGTQGLGEAPLRFADLAVVPQDHGDRDGVDDGIVGRCVSGAGGPIVFFEGDIPDRVMACEQPVTVVLASRSCGVARLASTATACAMCRRGCPWR